MFKYDIPIFVINEPSDYKVADIKNKKFVEKDVKIKIRQGGKDVELKVKTDIIVKDLINLYLKALDKNREEYNCRLFKHKVTLNYTIITNIHPHTCRLVELFSAKERVILDNVDATDIEN